MIDDLTYLSLGLLFVFILGAVSAVLARMRLYAGCWHRWGLWISRDTDVAYVQQRVCMKCGYTEVEQRHRIKGSA